MGALPAPSKNVKTRRSSKRFSFVAAMVIIVASIAAYALSNDFIAARVSGSRQAHAVTYARPAPIRTPQPKADFGPVISNALRSVVKLESHGCNHIFYSTGFVVAPGLVVTNAHGVAGTSSIYVEDGNGRHVGTPVLFDPLLDIAILRVNNLAGQPLKSDSAESQLSLTGSRNGDQALVLGYPLGGGIKSDLVTVADEYVAEIRDIYGKPVIVNVYELAAAIKPGSSGSPLINQSGNIIGIITSGDPNPSVAKGFAVPINAFSNYIKQAQTIRDRVSTQACVQE